MRATGPEDLQRPQGHWFESVADHLGAAYLRYSFTKGTAQEIEFLVGALDLRPGQRALSVAGVAPVAVDIRQRFVDIAAAGAPEGASFVRADARDLRFDAELDAAISLCQGAFGLAGGPTAPLDADGDVLAGIARALRPGGVAAVSAFSAYFQVRWLEGGDSFDADAGVNHERTAVRDEAGAT